MSGTCQRGHPLPEGGRCRLCHALAQADLNALIRAAAIHLGITRREYLLAFGYSKFEAEAVLALPATERNE